MSHEVETMFYAGETPWHQLGTGVEEALTSEEALEKAGLNWTVELKPLYYRYGESKLRFPDQFAIVRTSDGTPMGISSERYEPFQNVEAFSFLDSLVQDRVLTYETAGSLRNGQVVWMLAKLDTDLTIAGEGHKPYMLLTTQHDANGAIHARPCFMRVVCCNTLRMALSEQQTTVRVTHQSGLEARLAEAKNVLAVATEESRRLAEWLEKSATAKVSADEVAAVEEKLFGSFDDATTGQRKSAILKFREIYAAEDERNGQTAYSLVNAITGYADHALRYKGDSQKRAESRALSVMVGSADRFKQQGLVAVRELVNAG